METSKKVKIEFAPGCFDNFEGSQEELDELIQEITEMFQDPAKMAEMSAPVDPELLTDEEYEALGLSLSNEPRTLQ